MDPATLDEVFRTPPALHRFPGAMAGRTQELCRAIADDYGNDASRVWTEAASGKDLEARLLGLPGIGSMKAKTLVAILTKRFGVRPPGWEAVVPTHPTLADVDSPESLAAYQAGKRAKAELRPRPPPEVVARGCGTSVRRTLVADATTPRHSEPGAPTMDDRTRRALSRGHTIDITTTGRRTVPRRVEIVFHNIDGRLYISGSSVLHRERAWLNLGRTRI